MDTATILTLILAFPFLLLILSVFDPSKNSSVASPFLRWLQRKRYQYEVTFSLYMLTPTEKFVLSKSYSLICGVQPLPLLQHLPPYFWASFPPIVTESTRPPFPYRLLIPYVRLTISQHRIDSFLFLTLSLALIACSLYLPEHVLKMWHRAFYYYSGHAQSGAGAATAVLATTASEVAKTVLENATAAVEST